MQLVKANLRNHLSLAKQELKQRKFAILPNILPDTLDAVVSQFGSLVEVYGVKYYLVKPTTNVYSANSPDALYPHSDLNEAADNEVIVGLYTNIQDRFPQGGYTGICDMTPFFDALSAADRDYLMNREVTIVANSHLKKMGAEFYHGPMLKVREDGSYSFRFSYNFTQVLQDDTHFIALREQIIEYYHAHKISVKLPQYGLLLFDNAMCLHDRSNIYDMNRALYRFYIK